MNPEDRRAFEVLFRRHTQLEGELVQFKFDLKRLERRVELHAEIPEAPMHPPLPPAIPQDMATPPLPPIPPLAGVADFSPVAVSAPEPIEPKLEIPMMETTATAPEIPSMQSTEDKQRNLESQFGRWLARVGVVLLLLTVIYGSTVAYEHFHHFIGPWTKLIVLSLVSIGFTVLGLKMERWDAKLTVYARTLAGGGLACLYYTLYGATYVAPLQVIHSHVLGGFLLLGWSAYVLYLAERKKSELLSVFAIALAYFSSAITPVGDFTMVANLILSLTAVIFLIRNEWTGLSYLCLVGTYAGLLRQFVAYNSYAGLDFVRHVEFWPAAVYLAGAWVIYTAGIFLANTPKFAAEKRMAFLCLNNGAFMGLLLTAAELSDFGHMGGILCWTGGLFLVAWQAARTWRADMGDVAGAYLAQGLGLVTGGLAMIYAGATRGMVITIESVFLAAAGAYSRNWIFKIAGHLAALVGTIYLFSHMAIHDHSAVLPICAAGAMLANAWFARREWWGKPREEANAKFVLSSAYYVLLALVLAGTGLFTAQLSDDSITTGLAVTALVLTMAVYLVPIFELAPMSQILLVIAQATAFISFSGTAHQGASCQNIVALVTMVLVTWWPKQKQVRTGIWLQGLLMVYAIAIMAYIFNNLQPHLDDQQWMMVTSGLSLVFLAYGAFMGLWQFIVAGQLFLGYSVFLFLQPSMGYGHPPMPWTWWAAAVPPLTVYLTSWLIGQQLPRVMKASADVAEQMRMVGYLYRAVGLALVVRWIFGVVPEEETTLAFFALAAGLLAWNCWWKNAFSARAALVVDVVGMCSYVYAQAGTPTGFTWPDAMGVLLFLVQPAILRYWGRDLVTHTESWAVVALSALAGWYFVSNSIDLSDAHNLTLGWALFALGLTVLGFAANERRQRWCGLGILVASLIRVGVYDFWGFSDIYKFLTFLALTVICLGLSFLYYKFADRLKEWL